MKKGVLQTPFSHEEALLILAQVRIRVSLAPFGDVR